MVNYNGKYPVLKDTVRIKKLPNFCWIIELESDCNREIAPIEAFLLATCTGEWDLEQICHILSQTYRLDSVRTLDIVHSVLDELKECFLWQESPRKTNTRYVPSDFIYVPKLGVLAGQERCDTPCELYLSLTHKCNFRCIYCFNASGHGNHREIETRQWINMIRQAAEMGVIKCTLTGGEPMLYVGFYDILEELVRLDIMPSICTNGSLIDDAAVLRFKKLGIRTVQISMDSSTPDIHHRMTATRNTFHKVVSAIEKLTDAGIQVNVKTVLTPYNLDGIDQFIQLCNSIGVNKLTLDRFDVSSCGRGGSELLISERKMENVRKMVQENREKIADRLTVEAVAYPKRWSCEEDIVFCGAFRRSMIILPSGDVSVCEKLVDIPEMTVGNICTDTLYDIWNSPKITDILFPVPDKLDVSCRECEHLEKCGTGCYAIKYFLDKEPHSTDPRCWKASPVDNPYAQL